MGICLIMGLYHLGLYIQRRRDKGSLFFGILCLDMFIREQCTERMLEQFVETPNEPLYMLRYMTEYETMYLGLPIFLMFFHEIYPKWFPKRLIRASILLTSFWALQPFVLSMIDFSRFNLNFQYVIVGVIAGLTGVFRWLGRR